MSAGESVATAMATAPVKSQPLHNFSLSLLKWGNKSQINNQRYRKRDTPPSARGSPASEHESEAEPETGKSPIGSSPVKNPAGLASCSHAAQEHVSNNGTGRGDDIEKSQGTEKTWKLRPRRSAVKRSCPIGSGVKNSGESQAAAPVHAVASSAGPHPPRTTQNDNLPKSMRLRGLAESHGLEKKEKKKFWISLSREEIEEDIFIMTGSKPSRRPKKRAKIVQRNLDNVFPGLWLAGVTLEAYRVPDAPSKR